MGTECHYFICDVANREEVYKQAKVVREKVIIDNCCLHFSCTTKQLSVENVSLNVK